MMELDVQLKGTYKTEDVLRNMQTVSGITTPILPDGCVLYRNAGNGYEYYTCIRAPTVWQCGGPRYDTLGNTVFPLMVPWQIYLVQVAAGIPAAVSLFFSKGRITGTDTMIYRSLLPNQGDSGVCCIHSDIMRNAALTTTPLVTRLNRLISDVSRSNFNDDLAGYTLAQCAPFLTIPLDSMEIPGLSAGSSCTAAEAWLKRLAIWTRTNLVNNVPVMTAYDDVPLVQYRTLALLSS
jgi:hypothetical protein